MVQSLGKRLAHLVELCLGHPLLGGVTSGRPAPCRQTAPAAFGSSFNGFDGEESDGDEHGSSNGLPTTSVLCGGIGVVDFDHQVVLVQCLQSAWSAERFLLVDNKCGGAAPFAREVAHRRLLRSPG